MKPDLGTAEYGFLKLFTVNVSYELGDIAEEAKLLMVKTKLIELKVHDITAFNGDVPEHKGLVT